MASPTTIDDVSRAPTRAALPAAVYQRRPGGSASEPGAPTEEPLGGAPSSASARALALARREWRSWRGIAWTSLALTGATLIKLAAPDYIGPGAPFLLYVSCIIVASWFGGWVAGLAATGTSASLGAYLFLGTPEAPSEVVSLVWVGVFVCEGVAITAITSRFRKQRMDAVRAAWASRRSEEALRLSERWFSTALKSVDDGVIATDASARVILMNELAEDLTGVRSEAAAGRSVAEVFQISSPKIGERVGSTVERVLRDQTPYEAAREALLVSTTGREARIEYRVAPIRTSQGVAGALVVFHDVTEQRAEEVRRTFITEATAELASALDFEHAVETVTRLAVRRIADWCVFDLLENGALRRVAVANVDPAKVDLLYEIERRYPEAPDAEGGPQAVLRNGRPIFVPRISADALRAAARDAEHLALLQRLDLQSYICVPLTSGASRVGVLTLATAESGRALGGRDLELAAALADRAGLALAQARLLEAATSARAEAEQANRAKDEFLAMLGHELRNPLAPMRTALHVMNGRAPDVCARERAILDRQVSHLMALVDDLLDISRITSGKIELAREAVDLAGVVETALEMTSPLLAERKHVIDTNVLKGLVVTGDPVRMTQVVTNLLTNAAKYTEPGGRIDVRARRDAREIVLEVRDNGIGMDAELLPRVFHPFTQSRQALDRARGGLGLGLAITRSVVEMHGGTVEADSGGVGLGSTFRVRLPASAQADSEQKEDEHSAPPAKWTAARVLLVDDNLDALEMLEVALGMAGYETLTASDGAAALARVKEHRPDVAVVDIGLPILDGYEVAKAVRAEPGLQHIKLIALTGYGQDSDKSRALEAGFDEHLVKPIDVDGLLDLVARLCADRAPKTPRPTSGARGVARFTPGAGK